MGQRCDHCDREATVHEVVVRNGKRIERHLCEEHAREMGVILAQSHNTVQGMMQAFVVSKSGAARERQAARLACETCGMTFAEFRKEGLLGCPDCYRAFESKLGPLLERAHDGGTHHCGKVPRRAGASLERQAQLTALRRELQAAIEHEQYEKAASLRDEISAIESPDEGDGEGAVGVRRAKPSRESPAELRSPEDEA